MIRKSFIKEHQELSLCGYEDARTVLWHAHMRRNRNN